MLKTLDILIGTVTVLLIFSMAVTVITQAITAILNRKGKHLRDGITNLLQQLGISNTNFAKTIAEKVLTHPMISVGGRLGSVIHREEFTKLLLDLAAGEGAATLEGDAKNALMTVLKDGGISDPAEALRNIHDMALQLEAANPDLANHMRAALAVLHGVPSQFVSRIHSWFDQSIDRVSERFTQFTHVVVVGVSLAVVLFVQLDIVAVVERLSIDDQLRSSMVAQASKDFSKQVTAPEPETAAKAAEAPLPVAESCKTGTANDEIRKVAAEARAKAKTAGKSDSDADAIAAQAEAAATAKCNGLDPEPYYDLLGKAGLVTLPVGSFSNWWVQIKESRKWPGMLISVLLLSLGAPFWYKALAQLLQLRSAIAGKDDVQREQRQGVTASDGGAGSASAGSAATGTAVPATLPKGESGDLGAVG